ncbi:hypothetical protein C4J93_0469 [Pseudomonas sp. R2-37-08W]|nr:hypothetical protein C4J93_0469 [Pseudomonas sp. R2-37-08W]AZF35267.1 hypothetical protein C4J88_0454 [Pseudomonas sp. R4-39-08]AZF45731.1 hypothetical protein C4J86_0465 [Pseudomonas sp. R2-7-07]AZF56375.1 hypothetical protein C4J84_0468 [Pseudomonas sp. R11-23-07]
MDAGPFFMKKKSPAQDFGTVDVGRYLFAGTALDSANG